MSQRHSGGFALLFVLRQERAFRAEPAMRARRADSATTMLPERTGGFARSEPPRPISRGPDLAAGTTRSAPDALHHRDGDRSVLRRGRRHRRGQLSPTDCAATERGIRARDPGTTGRCVSARHRESGPDTPEPEHNSAIAITLREWLNMEGYQSVRFDLSGNTIILWGTVPNQLERRWVQTQATMLTGATSIVDHMTISPDPNPDADSEP